MSGWNAAACISGITCTVYVPACSVGEWYTREDPASSTPATGAPFVCWYQVPAYNGTVLPAVSSSSSTAPSAEPIDSRYNPTDRATGTSNATAAADVVGSATRACCVPAVSPMSSRCGSRYPAPYAGSNPGAPKSSVALSSAVRNGCCNVVRSIPAGHAVDGSQLVADGRSDGSRCSASSANPAAYGAAIDVPESTAPPPPG